MKKEKTVFYKSTACSCALFILGNAVIVLPAKSADQFTFLGFIITALCSVLLSLLLIPLARKLLKEGTPKIIKAAVMLILSLYALFVAADTFSDFTHFVSTHILKDTNIAFIIFVFGAAVVFFGFKRQEDVLKFALLCFVFTAVAVIFFFAATSSNFDVKNIYISEIPDFKTLFSAVRPYFIKAALPAVLLPFYTAFIFPKGEKSACVLGVGMGYIILGFCLLTSILLFSPLLAGRLSYPYASAVSTVTVGKLFTRMDGFSYFIYFSAAAVKINVCIFITISALKGLKRLTFDT